MKRAMSTVKNIAAAAMTLAVFFGFAGFKPVTANAAQAAMPATASVEEENSYFEEDAYQRSFLTLINTSVHRLVWLLLLWATATTTPLQWSVPKSWQFLTPTFVPTVSAISPFWQRTASAMSPSGENYMAGCSTPDSAMDQWMATDFTRERILNARCYHRERLATMRAVFTITIGC